MKKINLIQLTIITLLLSACGSKEASTVNSVIASGDLEQIRAKKEELSTQSKAIAADVALLDSAINANDENANIPLVTVIKVMNQEFNHYVELQGDVTTKQNVLIYPEVAGTLLRVFVKDGQRVSKGEILAKVDDGGMGSSLIQMKTQLALAKTTYERQERLWKQEIGSEIQYLQAKTNYESQKSAVDQMESQLSKYSIRAPFTGIIDDVIKDQGTVVAPGQGSEVFRIVNLSNMFIEVFVPESYVADVTVGKKVNVHFPVLGETIQSKVRQVGNFINPDNRSFTVEVPVPNLDGKVKPNLTAKVQINDYYKEEAILIPQSIISENAEGEQYAYIASNVDTKNIADANKVIITTGKTQGDYVEVLSGVTEGANIIEEGARSVKDGQKVKILKL